MASRRAKTHPSEIAALLLLAAGLLLLLALISFSTADLPGFFHLTGGTRAGRLGGNFIGPFGASIAYLWYSLLGASAYLLAAILLGWGSLKLLQPALRFPGRWLSGISTLLAGAGLAHLLGRLGWHPLEASRFGLPGEGGWLGIWMGSGIGAVFGPVGGSFVLGAIYLACVLLLAGGSPLTTLRRAAGLPRQGLERFRTWQEARALRARTEADLADRAAKARPLRLTDAPPERQPSRRGAKTTHPVEELVISVPGPGATEGTLEPAPEAPARPAPKIFDGTAPPAPRPRVEKPADTHTLAPISCEGYELPSIDLLDPCDLSERESLDPEELRGIQDTIIDTLAQFSIDVSPGDITRGPTITRYEVYPAKGVRVDRIASLERDLARATRAERINILAPIPGKDTVGIEIANSKKQKVTLRELLESEDFHNSKCRIPIALGKDVYGKTIVADLAAMPHGLVAGTTGSGKSVCINAIIASILYRFTPEDLRFIMIDPKVVEMQTYNTLPHLVTPVVTDPKKVLLALRWAVDEMEKRYAIFAKTGVRNIGSFNSRPLPKTQRQLDEEAERAAAAKAALEPEPAPVLSQPDNLITLEVSTGSFGEEGSSRSTEAEEPEVDPESLTSEERITNMTKPRNSRDHDMIVPDRMPYIVIIVDELADLMQTAPADVESAIARITQKARAAGIHMIIATQTPRADVITGVIKANVPCRIAFQVSSALDSRVILDENGAERLLGQGDLLYRPPGTSRMIRAQGVLVTDEEIQRVVEFASHQGQQAFESSIQQRLDNGGDGEGEEVSDEDEELVSKCLEVMCQEKKASTSLFQRRLRLGYTRAARILDILETRGYVGPGEGAKPREILVDLDALDLP